jgi:type VI secretion system protein VasI
MRPPPPNRVDGQPYGKLDGMLSYIRTLSFLAIVMPGQSYAALYKCEVNGKIEFSDKQCASDAVNLRAEEDQERKRQDEAIGEGQWTSSEARSPIDDSVNRYLSLPADNPVRTGYKSARPSLHIRCAEKKVSVFIDVGMYLGLDSTPVLVRFDNQRADTSHWSISTNHKAIFAPGKYAYMRYVDTLTRHDSMFVELTPYGENPIQFKFDLRGLRNVVGPIRQNCS